MRKRLGTRLGGFLILLAVSSSVFVAQRPQNRPAAARPAASDLKIKYRVTSSGQPMETTTMLKGSRERSELKMGYGMDIINITQCDLKRTIQISDSAKKYVITPMETSASSANAATDTRITSSSPSQRGGVVTYNTTAVDTGERKEMFGFTARHVKSSLSIDSSPDACTPMKMRMETDGWYIDLSFGLNCETGGAAMMGGPQAGAGCRDRTRFNRQGAARTGYALTETTNMYGPNGQVMYTSTREVVELSREPLDAALFDVPAGYVETQNTQELYVVPSTPSSEAPTPAGTGRPSAEVMQSAMSNTRESKAPGVLRVGVVQINNKTDRAVPAASLRERLISEIQGSGIEAVSLNAMTPGEAESEAKAKQCDFILYTDIAVLKTSAAKKIGGMLGRATGVGGGVDKTEAKIEYRLFAVGETAARLQSAATAKEEGDEASAGTAIELEARMVGAEVRKKNRN
jgi:hypothetical protein